MSSNGDILLVGGSSRLATAVVPILGATAIALSRRVTGHPREIIVADYGQPPATVWEGITCVVNCVGISTGSASELDRINITIPCRLAAAAKAAGVRHLIHVSSFSVYGSACAIDAKTPALPASDYGRSKLKADTALLALANDHFVVTIVRLPLVYAEKTLGKLGRLLRLWTRLGVLPVPAGDVGRAMIGVPLAAKVIARLVAEPRTGIVFAADPCPFTYADAAKARAGKLRRIVVPTGLVRLAIRLAPPIGGRLFADSRLADSDNLAIRYGLPSQLYRDITTADLSRG